MINVVVFAGGNGNTNLNPNQVLKRFILSEFKSFNRFSHELFFGFCSHGSLALGEDFIPDRIQRLILMYLILGFGYAVVWFKFWLVQINL